MATAPEARDINAELKRAALVSALAWALAENHRPRRRDLDDNDIVQLLEAMGAAGRSIQGPDRERLRHDINVAIVRSNIVAAIIGGPSTSTKIRRAQKIAHAAAVLSKALKDEQLDYELALERDALEGHADKLASTEEWLAAFPGAAFPGNTLWAEMVSGLVSNMLPLPSQAALAAVRQAHDGVDLLARLANSHIGTLRRYQKAMRSRASPRRPDAARYSLIGGLARVYEEFFGVTPPVTRDSAWVRFLAAVLSRCEGEPLDNDGAYDSWRKARQSSGDSRKRRKGKRPYWGGAMAGGFMVLRRFMNSGALDPPETPPA